MNFCKHNKMDDNRVVISELARSRFLEYQRKVEDEKNILKLLEEDYVRSICAFTTKYELFEKMIVDAWGSITEGKKRNKELKQLDAMISEDFVGENIKIKEIISIGYANYCWKFGFDYKKVRFELIIPMHKNINIKNYKYAYEGKYALGIKTDDCTEIFALSYNEDEIKKALLDKVKNDPGEWDTKSN